MPLNFKTFMKKDVITKFLLFSLSERLARLESFYLEDNDSLTSSKKSENNAIVV